MASQRYKITITREFPLRKFPEDNGRATITPGEYEVEFSDLRLGETWLVISSRGYGAPADFWAQWYERAWTQEAGQDILPQEER